MPEPHPRNQLLMSVLGRSLTVVLLTLLGTIGGAIVGGFRAIPAIQAIPPAPNAMGFAAAGFIPPSSSRSTSLWGPRAGRSWGW